MRESDQRGRSRERGEESVRWGEKKRERVHPTRASERAVRLLDVVGRVALLRAGLLGFRRGHHGLAHLAQVLVHGDVSVPSFACDLRVVDHAIGVHARHGDLLREGQRGRLVWVVAAAFQLHAVDAVAEGSLQRDTQRDKRRERKRQRAIPPEQTGRACACKPVASSLTFCGPMMVPFQLLSCVS